MLSEKSHFKPLSHQPTSNNVTLRADVECTYHLNMKTALEDIGGIGSVLFLFAKVQLILLLFKHYLILSRIPSK